MSQRISEEQETALRRLLERAKQAIPFLRLDKADEVTSSFESSLALLNRCLIPDTEVDSHTPRLSGGNPAPSFYSEADDGEDTGISMFSVEPLDDLHLPEPSPREAPPAAFVKPLNKNVVGMRGVTRDFSSPSLKKRQLGVPKTSQLSASAPTSPSPSFTQMGQQSSRAPSSRATASRPGGTGGAGLGLGLGKSSGGDDLKKAVFLKKLNLGSARPVTRDTDSPKLGSRGLGSKPAPFPSCSASSSSMEPQTKTDGTKDLVSGVKRETGLLDAPHSPMQQNTSRRLLGLAAKSDDRGPSPSKEAVFPVKTVQKIPGSPSTFLRPLNHPSTRAAELITAKVQLKKLVQQGEELTSRVKKDCFEEVYSRLLESVELLEKSTTTAKKNPPGYAP